SDGEIFTRLAQKLGLTLTIDIPLQAGHLLPSMPEHFEAPTPVTNQQANLRATFAHALFDNGVRMKHDPHVIQLAKEPRVRIHPQEGSKRGIKDNSEVQLNGTITAKVLFDDQVSEGTVVIPLGFDEIPAHNLATNLLNGLPIEIGKEQHAV